MDKPTMFDSREVAPDTQALLSYMPVPGFGILPVNAFVIRSPEPVLVDTGLAALGNEFMKNLRSVVDLRDLRWLWLTHMDPDHLGSVRQILAEAPNARVVTTYLGMGKMGLHGLPLDRVYLLNPGQQLDVGDRNLVSIAPPTFDAPETTALFDDKTRALFSADCFGALMSEPAESAADVSPQALRDGMLSWAAVDAPWLEAVAPDKFLKRLDAVRRYDPRTVLSAHLPPAEGMTQTLLSYLASAPGISAFQGPDQAALERMMSQAQSAA